MRSFKNLVFLPVILSTLVSCNQEDLSKIKEQLKEELKEEVVDDTAPTTPTTPLPTESEDLKIVIISDLNGSYGSVDYNSRIDVAISKINEVRPDLVLVTGDMVAGQKKGLNYEAMWDGFHRTVTVPLSMAGIPVFVTPGNHDASAYSGFEQERAIYKREWESYQSDYIQDYDQITKVDMSNYPFYYSFAFKGTLFISLDGTKTSELDSTQKAWLLSQVKTPVEYKNKVVFSHLPFHPVAQGRENDYIRDASNSLYKELKSSGVNLFLSGHHHSYYPGVYDGTRFVSQSCLGSGPRKLISSSSTSKYSFTMVDFSDGIKVDAYDYPSFKKPVPRSSLPSKIKSPKGGYLNRDDTVFSNVSIGNLE
ncbi:metallophosphoesterase [Bacteriovorax sp. Seq25_V]|uniref:metallophosphoesterase family protein n=1 Tax=Bacteriovorax sp. Seq25_V TaxID=1201288 RepID=UPI00038A2E50|nr:metallophosphoesterase [Bacteriovorax sp. Seq25_V]EQC47727.1 calcineurin-like phosphoesterase family protein [Bacteriovorax sp. Seq25_V]